MNQYKLKIYHIHNDPKFISSTRGFESNYFDNHIIVLGSYAKYDIYSYKTVTFFEPNRKNIEPILRLCKNADLVVLYGLCNLKSRIANRLPIGIKIAWRFFGYELYNERKNLFLSATTLKVLELRGVDYFIEGIKKRLRTIRQFVFWGSTNRSELYKALLRIDYFLGLSVDEYDVLLKLFNVLPRFVQLPFGLRPEQINNPAQKQNIIILGNSRSPFNNHLDVINEIVGLKNYNNYSIIVPFSYPDEKTYYRQMSLRTKEIGNIDLMEGFIPIDEYECIYEKASAFIMNSIRQLGVGNIFLAIRNKVKIYMNPNNVLFDWFLREGFEIYSISSLEEDIENNNIRLASKIADKNINMLTTIRNKYNVSEFQNYFFSELSGVINQTKCNVSVSFANLRPFKFRES